MPDARPAAERTRPAETPPKLPRRTSAFAITALFFASVVGGALPAAASTSTGTLRAKAAAIAQKIAADDAALNALGEAYLADRTALEKASAAARASTVVVHRLSGFVAKDRLAASTAAASAYVDAGSTDNLGVYLAERPDQFVQSAAYLNSALSILDAAASAYAHAEANWRSALGRERRDAAFAKAALAEANNERSAVLTTLSQEQQLQKSVNGEIAKLVAEQLDAKLAAERAAAAAAAAASQRDTAGPPAPNATTLSAAAPGSLAAQFAALRNCESSGNYGDNTGNGYYGAYQFSLSTWDGLGLTGLPSQALAAVQDSAAFTLYQHDGWAPWPACAAILGL